MRQYIKTIVMLAICIIFIGFMNIVMPRKQPKRDYEVFNSFILSIGNYRDVKIKVAIYKNHHSKELYKRIQEEENYINGTPTKLTIQLYYSKEDSREGREPYTTISIGYENNTYEIIH